MAGQFIVDTVITIVLEGIKTFVTTAFTAIALMLEQLFPLVEVQSTSPLKISVDGNPIVFSMDVVGRGLTIAFGDMVFDIKDVLTIKPETLGLVDNFELFLDTALLSALGESIFLFIVWLLLSNTRGMPPQAVATAQAIAIGLFVANAIIQYVSWVNWVTENKNIKNFSWQYHLWLGLNLIKGVGFYPWIFKNKKEVEILQIFSTIGLKIFGEFFTGYGIVSTNQLKTNLFPMLTQLMGQFVSMSFWMILLQDAKELEMFAFLRGYTFLLGLVHLLVARGIRAI